MNIDDFEALPFCTMCIFGKMLYFVYLYLYYATSYIHTKNQFLYLLYIFMIYYYLKSNP